ncbi:glycosyltransferase family 4 protein [Sinosporangium siamense]|uniref:GDP-mannose-dependent alpha-(1-6)-phosphatidylinositol dimannoside mannosyltransferase n=1 Tax=Sinosporangium siamense TaxID=1367973 RepID=A0A919V617_9ACTN|nr:glycosyltransferase family 4 protein [Sinosporangium siamense]GII91501.1 GDP-mannose-dependent alpha-(1-6)-phosphatidylinositol dimannoside mannosyltransferase [Sinosporangium siamense]
MRILHVSDCYLPRLGGIEVQVADLVRMQRAAGHVAEVATATGGDRLTGVYRIVSRMPFDLPVHPFGVGHLMRLMAARRPEVVHVHAGAVSPFAWMGVRAAVRVGLPVVVTVHSMWDPVTQGLYRALRLAFEWQRWGLVATTVSEAAARPIRSVAGRRVPVRVVANGLDFTDWRPTEVNPPRAGDGVHVVAVGRLAPRKHPVRLLKLLEVVRRRLPASVPLRATIVGDGPARGSMRRFLESHGMAEWVGLPGRLTREEIRKVLAEADVFVAPAPRESFGIAALEARSAGVPVVARAESGVADFIRPGKEGLLGGSSEELAAAVVRLARDEDLRGRIAAHNRTTEPVECSWPAVLEGFDRAYEQAVGLAPPGRP